MEQRAKSWDEFDVFADSTGIEEKVEEEIEAINNSTEETKEKIMITNKKV